MMDVSYYRLKEVEYDCHDCDGKGVVADVYCWGDKLAEWKCGRCHGEGTIYTKFRVPVYQCSVCGIETESPWPCCDEEVIA